MKALYGLVMIVGVHIALEPPAAPEVLALEIIETAPTVPIGINDLNALKDSIARLARKPLTSLPSSPLQPQKIPRTISDGHLAKIDCKTLDLQINFAIRETVKILEPIEGAHSILTETITKESYQQAQRYYRNALSALVISFNLKCYDAFEKINQVFAPFVELEYKKKSSELDRPTVELYHSLKEVLRQERQRRKHADPPHLRMSTHISKDLTEIRQDKAQKSLENGRAFRDGVRTTRKSITNPSLEHYEFIELLTFNAFEHFITAFNCDSDEALVEAKEVLEDLKTIHDWKLQTHKIVGTRYTEALEKYNTARKSAVEMQLIEEATDNSAPGKKLANSEKTVRELYSSNQMVAMLNEPLAPKTTPFTLLKSVGINCKKAGKETGKSIKYLWNKLPFNRSDT